MKYEAIRCYFTTTNAPDGELIDILTNYERGNPKRERRGDAISDGWSLWGHDDFRDTATGAMRAWTVSTRWRASIRCVLRVSPSSFALWRLARRVIAQLGAVRMLADIGRVRDPKPSPTDLIAAIRAGVESGTIKGEVVEWCEVHRYVATEQEGRCNWHVAYDAYLPTCSIVSRLLLGGGT